MLDLYHATRADLIRIILEQRDALADRDRQLAALTAEQAATCQSVTALTAQVGALLAASARDGKPPRETPRGMPGLRPTEPDGRDLRPRKRRAKGAGRHRMEATAHLINALAECPDCGGPLAGRSSKRTREVIDLPPPEVVVTEHVYLERRCPDCGRGCVPPPDLTGIVPGQGRVGTRLVSLIATLREEARLPFATIQRLLQTLTGLHLSVGALVVHADETGWRENGRNG